MKKNILLSCIFGIAIPAFYSTAYAEQMYGIFMVTKGSVKVQSVKAGTVDAKVGLKVYEGDTITTAADSRAKIVMSDRNVINLSPDSKMQIAKYENDAGSGKKNVELNLLQGKVRNNVEQTYDGDKSKFLIKTPTAVAGVRGTQFLAGFNPQTMMTTVVTFKGSVSLASLNPQGQVIGAPVVVKKGEMTNAAPNSPPEAPKVVPKEEIKKMDVETASSASSSSSNTTADAAGGKREVANESSSSGSGTSPTEGGVKETPREMPKEVAPPMIDKKDMDVGMAKDIKDVRGVQAPPPPAQNIPRVPSAVDGTSPVRDIIRDNLGKTRVIIRPQPVGQ